jgi:hypothetical protein
MKSKNTLIFLLSLVALGALAFAWKEYQELAALRATAVDPAERAGLQKRVWDSEKHVRELESRIASGQPGAPVPGAAAGSGPARGAGGGGLLGNVFDRMNDPEVQRLMAEQIRAQIERRYAKLFPLLNLPPDKLEQFKSLLVDRQQSAMDVLASANEQGITDPRDFQKLVESSQADIDGQIKAAIGDADYAQYQGFNQSQAARGMVSQLQDNLRSSAAPLSSAQSDQLTQLMAQSRTAPEAGGLRGSNAPALITDDTITQSQAFLSAPQVQALQQLQQQQQANRRLQQMILQGPDATDAAKGAAARGAP